MPDELRLANGIEPPVYGSLPSEKLLDRGKEHYQNGDYGLAEQAFRKAIEEDRNNSEAWLGLAASYDRLRRFDLAERAYRVLTKLAGRTPVVLNNMGYHYMLRGDYASARRMLAAARQAEPDNPFVRTTSRCWARRSLESPIGQLADSWFSHTARLIKLWRGCPSLAFAGAPGLRERHPGVSGGCGDGVVAPFGASR